MLRYVMEKHYPRLQILGAALFLVILGTGAEWIHVPDADAKEAPALTGSTWSSETASYAIRLQRIDAGERQAYFSRLTGLEIDPFASPPDRSERFLSFLVEVENRGVDTLEMNPVHCWLKTSRGAVQTPIGLTDLAFSYRVAGGELPPGYERIKPALLENTRSIPPGESVHGLLIYRAVEPKTKFYRVDVQLSMPNGDAVRFAAPYRRKKIKR
jgi:hypothetical protein